MVAERARKVLNSQNAAPAQHADLTNRCTYAAKSSVTLAMRRPILPLSMATGHSCTCQGWYFKMIQKASLPEQVAYNLTPKTQYTDQKHFLHHTGIGFTKKNGFNQ